MCYLLKQFSSWCQNPNREVLWNLSLQYVGEGFCGICACVSPWTDLLIGFLYMINDPEAKY